MHHILELTDEELDELRWSMQSEFASLDPSDFQENPARCSAVESVLRKLEAASQSLERA